MLSVLRAISMDNTEQMEEMEDSEEGEEEIFEQSTKWEAFLGCVLDIFFICLFPISAWWCFKTVQVCHFKSFNTVYSTLRAPNIKVSFFSRPTKLPYGTVLAKLEVSEARGSSFSTHWWTKWSALTFDFEHIYDLFIMSQTELDGQRQSDHSPNIALQWTEEKWSST